MGNKLSPWDLARFQHRWVAELNPALFPEKPAKKPAKKKPSTYVAVDAEINPDLFPEKPTKKPEPRQPRRERGPAASRRADGVFVAKPGQRQRFVRKMRRKIERDEGPVRFDLPPKEAPQPRQPRQRVEEPKQLSFDFKQDTKATKATKATKGAQCQPLPSSDGKYQFSICGNGPEQYTVYGYFGGQRVGSVQLSSYGEGRFKVSWAGTDEPSYWRLLYPKEAMPAGLGTKLYERALRATCDVAGSNDLISDTVRSPFSEAFWRKQERKGRAECIGDGGRSRYFDAPLRDAEDAFAARFGRGYKETKEWKQFVSRLPTPNGRRWPCDYYAIECQGRPDSLTGVRYAIITDRKKRRKR